MTPETQSLESPAPDTTTAELAEDASSLDSTAQILKNLPAEAFAFLVRSLPPRESWQWFNEEEQTILRDNATRGFQRHVAALRQPIVRARLAKHFAQNPLEARPLLNLWAQTEPAPRVAIEVREENDDALLIEQLPQLWRRHGGEALALALAHAGREAAVEALASVAEGVDEETDLDEAAPQSTVEPLQIPADAAQSTAEPSIETAASSARLQTQIDENRARIETLQSALAASQSALKSNSDRARLEIGQSTRSLKAAERRGDQAESALNDAKRLLDRTERRFRHEEKEHEEIALENKRLKRQMRRQQEINEELRKQIAQQSARLEQLEPKAAKPIAATPKVPQPVKATPISALDKTYIWTSDNRPFRVSPREVQKRVDANDDEWVFRLIQALDALREVHPAGHRLFMDALRGLDRYYSRVLTADTTRVLVDASNVARQEKDRYGRGQLRHLIAMRDELRRRDCFPITMIADASLPYNIDEPQQLHALARRGEIEFTNAGQEADELLAREARRSGAYVVTNDRGFFLKVTPDFEPPRITFRIHDGFLIVDDF